ncbi:MAG: hypothetical protein LKJ86_10020 [Oscillibacter sp.]|nr:hypothetical protein [Oscillibacter sp.]
MNKKAKKRAAAAAVTAVASASVLVGGLFPSPADLLNDGDASTQTAVTQSVEDDAGTEEVDEETQRRRGSVRARLRQWIRQLPVGVRAVVGVPLWCIGWVMLTGLSTLWSAVLSPVAGTLAGWACLAAVLVGVFALTAKAMFPDLPMKKILRKRNVLGIVAGVALLGIADTLLPYVWDGYEKAADAVRLTGSFVVVLVVVWVMAVGEVKSRRKAAAKTEKVDEQERIRRRARELADSVR